MQADSIIPDYYNPQSLNRYSYTYNNPIKYTDPGGETPWDVLDVGFFVCDLNTYWNVRSIENRNNLALSTVSLLPIIPNARIAKAGLSIGNKALDAARVKSGLNIGGKSVDAAKKLGQFSNAGKWSRPETLADHLRRHGDDFGTNLQMNI